MRKSAEEKAAREYVAEIVSQDYRVGAINNSWPPQINVRDSYPGLIHAFKSGINWQREQQDWKPFTSKSQPPQSEEVLFKVRLKGKEGTDSIIVSKLKDVPDYPIITHWKLI